MMNLMVDKYIKILFIELEDLYDDIELIIAQYEARQKKHEITEYVFFENLAVLKNEMIGIDSFRKIIHEVQDAGGFKDVLEFVELVKKQFAARVRKLGIAEVIRILIERKLNKVLKYVTHE